MHLAMHVTPICTQKLKALHCIYVGQKRHCHCVNLVLVDLGFEPLSPHPDASFRILGGNARVMLKFISSVPLDQCLRNIHISGEFHKGQKTLIQ